MNPPYYHQHSAGPPQPPWQTPPAAGWGDPRLQQAPQSPSGQYNPNAFGHISGQQPVPHPPPPPPPPPAAQPVPPPSYGNYHSQNTTPWGVNYNHPHHQHHQPQYHTPSQSAVAEQRPALPPRPGSALAQSQTPVPPAWQPQGSWAFPSPDGRQSTKPPTPPPRPAAYAVSQQLPQSVFPHDQYSQQPPTHNYDPPGPAPPNQWSHQTWHHPSQSQDGTVSPVDDSQHLLSMVGREHTVSPLPAQMGQHPGWTQQSGTHSSPTAVQVGAQAIGGFGQPSDWQHYQPDRPQQTPSDSLEATPTAPTAPRREDSDMYSSTASQDKHSNHQQYSSASLQVRTESPAVMAAVPVHDQTTSAERSGDVPENQPHRTDTIDDVIQSWASPLQDRPPAPLSTTGSSSTARHGPQHVQAPLRAAVSNRSVQTDFAPEIKTEYRTETVVEQKEVDPYGDITHEYAATLKRFAAMLRQEAAANEDEDKFKIFQGFVIRELRLRSVLYGVEVQGFERASVAPVASTAPHPSAIPSAAVASSQTAVPSTSQNPSTRSITGDSPAQSAASGLESETDKSKDDSFVVVDAEDGQFSPGGRPVMHSTLAKSPPQLTGLPGPAPNPVQNMAVLRQQEPSSPSANAPMTLDDYVMPDPPSPPPRPVNAHSDGVEIAESTQAVPVAALTAPINFQPPRPVYTPFRYQGNPDAAHPVITVDTPTESYTELRQTQAVESGRMLALENRPKLDDLPRADTASASKNVHEEAFIGLIRRQSKAIRQKTPDLAQAPPNLLRAGTPSHTSTASPAPSTSPLADAVAALRHVVPSTLPTVSSNGNDEILGIKSDLAKLPNEFGFIHATVLAWDKENRVIRQRLDNERQARQSDNEARIDELFHDNEIGYADIGNLERDFKLTEASKKYQEDKLELESFVTEVFEDVVRRLDGQVSELNVLFTRVRDQLDLHSQSSGKDIELLVEGKAAPATGPMAEVITVMLQIFGKIEIRHQKIAEARFERERRSKRLELSVLYTNNDREGIKKLEQEFVKAEKYQIFDEALKKSERANRLMDTLDRAVVRGLAENQGWLDEVLSQLQLTRDLLLGSEENFPRDAAARERVLYGADGVKEVCGHAEAALNLVLADSQQLIRLNSTADKLLNESDFAMVVARSRITDGDAQGHDHLRQEKEKEDGKLQEELDSRLHGTGQTPAEALGLIREMRDKIGPDLGHQERLAKALEEAKKRNADSTPAPGSTVA